MNSPPASCQRTAFRWLLSLVAVSAFALLSGCDRLPGFLNPGGPIAHAQREHLGFVILMVMIVVLPVLVLTPWLVWRYRYSGQARYRPRWSFSKLIDVLIWGVPVVVVGVLSVVLWQKTIALDPYKPIESDKAPLEVQVIGFDWKWLFIYPDQGVATLGRLILPTDRPVSFTLTSATVMQTFFIPALGSQIDVMNRMVTRLNLIAEREGNFMGRNIQYNGEGFYKQQFTTQTVSQNRFDTFIDQIRTQGHTLDQSAYTLLKAQNTWKDVANALSDDPPPPAPMVAFSQIPDGLFHAIARHQPVDWASLAESSEAASDTSERDIQERNTQ
ncbi:hypothetical protein [Larsenimonas salina]|uniref:hypothetical protein n=1 Tax=Larsenimonas salina TaxID=1295565 RepID=UPI002074709E|nr:hypothetical protein [Larsenimonas salina]